MFYPDKTLLDLQYRMKKRWYWCENWIN